MKTYFIYIIGSLSVISIYILYLIGIYKYTDIQVDIYVAHLGEKTIELERSIADKSAYLKYIQTMAYRTRIAKAIDRKKNPGEVLYTIIHKDTKENIPGKIDVLQEVLREESTDKKSITQNMTNPQKWIYYIFKLDTRSV